MTNIREKIEEMASRRSIPSPTRTLVFFNELDNESNKLLSSALRTETATEEEIFSLTSDLLNLWVQGDSQLARSIFGNIYDLRKSPLIATLTGYKNQMRFWIGQPGAVGQSHCDSAGEPYLVEIRSFPGGRRIPEKYIDLTSQIIARPFKLPNNGMVFAKGNESNIPKYFEDFTRRFQKIDYY